MEDDHLGPFERPIRSLREFITLLMMMCGNVSMAIGGALLIYQVIDWLRVGHWRAFPILEPLIRILPQDFTSWLIAPKDWLGLHKIVFAMLYHTPLSLVLLGIGSLVYFIGKWSIQKPREEI
jgi:hypothetical protein